ncbi:MAG: pimeloyl-ACP methyl ester carboxylesterase [Verrucomicrobiales bacterium]
MTSLDKTAEIVIADEVRLQVLDVGDGPPLLYLHPGYPSGPIDADSELMAGLRGFRVIAPTHPGFGDAPTPRWMTSVDDLAYLYLDLLDQLALQNVILVGESLGGWIGAEMAIKSTERLSSLVLINPVGIKVSDRETRDLVDIFAVPESELLARAFADPDIAHTPNSAVNDEALVGRARSREATARYAWSPYLHDPKLFRRLRRIDVPSVVLWGADDRIARVSYGRAFAEAIPKSTFHVVDDAGHFPDRERPADVSRLITDFAADRVGTSR